VKAVDADEGLNAELEYSVLDPPNSPVQLFGIHRQSGGLYVLGDLKQHQEQVFQFFVRVTDRGTPPQDSHLAVEIYVMGPDDQAPLFERKEDKFFMSEDAEVGKSCIWCQENKNCVNDYISRLI